MFRTFQALAVAGATRHGFEINHRFPWPAYIRQAGYHPAAFRVEVAEMNSLESSLLAFRGKLAFQGLQADRKATMIKANCERIAVKWHILLSIQLEKRLAL